jgi:hypothetical protein
MAESRGPLAELIAAYVERVKPAARALREEARRAGIHLPPSQLGQTEEDVASLVQPAARTTVDVEALKARLRDLEDETNRNSPPSPVDDPEGYGRWDAERIEGALAEDRAKAPEILGELRDAAEPLLDGTDDSDSAGSVVLAALMTLTRIQTIVVRELGYDWRGRVRPFGALARRKGAQVGAAWVGDAAGGVEPITLADAVELLAVDRAQFRREADESRTRAGESVEQGRAALQQAASARRQVDEIRRLLEEVLRPNAEAIRWCDECEAYDVGSDLRCEDHADLLTEPPLSSDLAGEVARVIKLWREAQNEARSAARGRVSVYVDRQHITGPEIDGAGNADHRTLKGPWFIAVGTLAAVDQAREQLDPETFEVILDDALPAGVRDLRRDVRGDVVEALIYCGHKAGGTLGCVLLDGHKGRHVGRDTAGRYREFNPADDRFAPLGTGQWIDHARQPYAGDEFPVWRSMFPAPDGRRTLLYADGSRRTVAGPPPEPPGPGEVVEVS